MDLELSVSRPRAPLCACPLHERRGPASNGEGNWGGGTLGPRRPLPSPGFKKPLVGGRHGGRAKGRGGPGGGGGGRGGRSGVGGARGGGETGG